MHIYRRYGLPIYITENGLSCKFKRLGIPDCYCHFGPSSYTHKTYGYDADAVVAAVKSIL